MYDIRALETACFRLCFRLCTHMSTPQQYCRTIMTKTYSIKGMSDSPRTHGCIDQGRYRKVCPIRQEPRTADTTGPEPGGAELHKNPELNNMPHTKHTRPHRKTTLHTKIAVVGPTSNSTSRGPTTRERSSSSSNSNHAAAMSERNASAPPASPHRQIAPVTTDHKHLAHRTELDVVVPTTKPHWPRLLPPGSPSTLPFPIPIQTTRTS